MLDQAAAQLAFRNRAIGTTVATTVATTGSTSLSATSSGYARAAGSFIADGFYVGMEITTASGFARSQNNVAAEQGKLITGVTALTLSCAGCAADGAAAGRVLTVGLPFCRAWELVHTEPGSGFPYIEEDFVPATSELISSTYDGGVLEETGLYVLRVYGVQGFDVLAIRKYAQAIRARFASGTAFAIGNDTLRISGDTGPTAPQIEPLGDGWAAVAITIPWFAHSINTVAA